MLYITLLIFQHNRVTQKKSYSRRTASVEKEKVIKSMKIKKIKRTKMVNK